MDLNEILYIAIALVQFLFRKITERKMSEEKLFFEDEKQIRQLLDNTNLIAVILDTTGNLIYYNSYLLSISGYTDDDLKGVNWFRKMIPGSDKRVLDEFGEIIVKEKVASHYENRIQTKSGELRDIFWNNTVLRDQNGRITGTASLGQDITSRKSADKSLKESEIKYRNIFNNNPVPMWIYDLETLSFLEVNDAAIFEYGYSEEEFKSMTLRDIRPDEDVPLLLDDVRKTFKIFNKAGRWRHKKKCGDIIWVEIVSHTINYNDHPARLVLANNVTEQKENEDEILRLNQTLESRVSERTAQLEAMNKELESFSYSVSHDLRAPLRHISGFADILKQDYENYLPDDAKHYLLTISESARRMGEMIEDLLNFSRFGRIEMRKTRFEMDSVINDVIKEAEFSPEGREIEWTIAKMPEVSGDYNLLRLVWMNLIDNAVKYTRPVGKAVIRIGYFREPNELVFFISDNGVGFDMKYAGNLFGVFNRLHSTALFEGTGIGLANVRRVIQRHGGRTWAESKLNNGATIFFSLPETDDSIY